MCFLKLLIKEFMFMTSCSILKTSGLIRNFNDWSASILQFICLNHPNFHSRSHTFLFIRRKFIRILRLRMAEI